ncbi:hypothetical protein NIES4102_38270 [Chondrocystis sp. NIES-4102]|nr:hypothetical protein NIES4102_38270 [Chondrocystis sp. NIES-4102]
MRYLRLTPQSNALLRHFLGIQTKMLGEILQEADLVSSAQIQAALEVQLQSPDLKVGEILAKQGLIKPETADFFAQDWLKIIAQPHKNALGYYLRQAAILNSAQIELILAEQRVTGVRFGTVAVFQGFLKSTTLDYFLANLFPEELHVSPFINMSSQNAKF